jgi:murein DD-endopeptidase / murein LD-carboxypeptidase
MADRIIARARALLGMPFRLHGRDPDTGLDCVGLVSEACQRQVGIPTGYALRGGSADSYSRTIAALRLTRRRGEPRRGDILLMVAGPQQFHLGLWTGDSLIHADAMLRRVVETPGAVPWPIIGAWHNRKRRD